MFQAKGEASPPGPAASRTDSYSICVLGGGAVGKSSLILRYLHDEYEEKDCPDPTLQDEYTALVEVASKSCTYSPQIMCVYPHAFTVADLLTFIDTAGQEQYMEHRREAIESANGYIVVYDVAQRSSFEEAEGFVNEICRVRGRDTGEMAVIILGNKCDVEETKRQVPRVEARRYALGTRCAFMEVSASSGLRVKESLELLLAELTVTGKEGWLWKVPDNATSVKNWKRRWFVLNGEDMRCYKSDKLATNKKPLSLIKLRIVDKVVKDDSKVTKTENAFLVVTPNRTYVFHASDRAERDDWARILKGFVKKKKNQRKIDRQNEKKRADKNRKRRLSWNEMKRQYDTEVRRIDRKRTLSVDYGVGASVPKMWKNDEGEEWKDDWMVGSWDMSHSADYLPPVKVTVTETTPGGAMEAPEVGSRQHTTGQPKGDAKPDSSGKTPRNEGHNDKGHRWHSDPKPKSDASGIASPKDAGGHVKQDKVKEMKEKRSQARESMKEQGKDKGRDADKDKETDKSKDKDADKNKDKERDKGKGRDKDKEADKNKDKERDKSKGKERDKSKDRHKDKDRDKSKETNADKDKERNKERDKEKDRKKNREKERNKGKEKDRDRRRAKEKNKDKEKDKGGKKEGVAREHQRSESRDKRNGKESERESPGTRHRNTETNSKDRTKERRGSSNDASKKRNGEVKDVVRDGGS